MGMNFTVRVFGKVEFADIDASDLGIDASEVIGNEVGYGSSVEFEDAEVKSGTVTVTAQATLHDIEVAAEDMGNYDAEAELDNAIDSYSYDLSRVDFEVTDSPTGFEAVEAELDRDSAISAYAALAKAGFEVVSA